MPWELHEVGKASVKNPILIEGLPGMGNVGKIVVDFLIDALNAKKIYELTSYDLPHCVFVNEENMVELPTINIYYTKLKNASLLLLTGDIQPVSESSCYEFCNQVLDTFEKKKGREIIALGGIGLQRLPKNPQVYCTGVSKQAVSKYKQYLVNTNIYGKVGPIVGVSGVLTGLAGRRKLQAVALLAETWGQPNHLGLRGARNILKVLSQKLGVKIKLEELDKEIKDLEQEMNGKPQKKQQVKNVIKFLTKKEEESEEKSDVAYIG